MGYQISSSCSFVLVSKLKALESNLKVWNKEVFSNIAIRKKIAFNRVGFWDAKEREFSLSLEEVEAKRMAKEESCKWASLEEVSWKQKKSREIWLKGGDRNIVLKGSRRKVLLEPKAQGAPKA